MFLISSFSAGSISLSVFVGVLLIGGACLVDLLGSSLLERVSVSSDFPHAERSNAFKLTSFLEYDNDLEGITSCNRLPKMKER